MNPAPHIAGDERLVLQPQEIPLDHPDSTRRFRTPLYVTRAAALEFGVPAIVQLHRLLVEKGEQYDGLDRLQIFRDPEHPQRRLWFIEDGGEEAHVTALLPEDY